MGELKTSVSQIISKKKLETIKNFIKVLQRNWERAAITARAAAMAYYALLAMFPLLLVFVNVLPLLPLPQAEILTYLQTALPENIYDVIQPVLTEYLNSGTGGGIISIGLITALWSASTVITVLRTALNDIYGVVDAKKNYLIRRLLSVAMILSMIAAIGAVLLIFVFGEYVLNFTESLIGIHFPLIESILSLTWIVLLVGLLVFFLIVYHVLPNHHLPIKYALPGAVFSTLGWFGLSQGFSIYLRFAGGDAVTNATFGGFIILMLFLFLSGVITFMGALVNTISFEWSNQQSIIAYEEEKHREEEEQEETYPSENQTILKRKIVKINKYPNEKY